MTPENPKEAAGRAKATLAYLPLRVMYGVALALLEGMLKYGAYNFRAATDIKASTYYGAFNRHIAAWWEMGEDLDPDSKVGLHHIDKAIASLVVLRDAMYGCRMIDDRPPSAEKFMDDMNKKASALYAEWGDKAPQHFTIADTNEAAHANS